MESYIMMLSGSTGDGSSTAFQNPLGKKRLGSSKTAQSELTGFCSHVSTTSWRCTHSRNIYNGVIPLESAGLMHRFSVASKTIGCVQKQL